MVHLTYTIKGGRIRTVGNSYFSFRYLSPVSTVTSLLCKDFILRGSIRDSNSNQKHRLSFASVEHQIYEPQRQGYTDNDIVSSLVRRHPASVPRLNPLRKVCW